MQLITKNFIRQNFTDYEKIQWAEKRLREIVLPFTYET
jgi:hypothetical protein